MNGGDQLVVASAIIVVMFIVAVAFFGARIKPHRVVYGFSNKDIASAMILGFMGGISVMGLLAGLVFNLMF